MGNLVGQVGARQSRVSSDHSRIGRAMEPTVQASFLQLQLSKTEGGLAPKLRFHIFHFHFSTEAFQLMPYVEGGSASLATQNFRPWTVMYRGKQIIQLQLNSRMVASVFKKTKSASSWYMSQVQPLVCFLGDSSCDKVKRQITEPHEWNWIVSTNAFFLFNPRRLTLDLAWQPLTPFKLRPTK